MLSQTQLNEEFLTSLLAYQKMAFSHLFHAAASPYAGSESALFVDVSGLIAAVLYVLRNLPPQWSSSCEQTYIPPQRFPVAGRSESGAVWNFQSNPNVPFPLRLHAIEASCLDHGNAGMPYANGDVSHP